ncbi:MAG: Spore coat protein CotH, partial [Deltaproteobacteria bacterium]|nr:Spore coat protein CotH [Deltaproteobacteria bacterium]
MRIVTMLGSIAMAAACGATPPDDGAGAPDGGSDTSGLDYERLFPADRVVDVDLAISQADWDALLVDPRQDVWVPATLTYDGVTVPQIAMRLKGNSSRFSV